MVSCAKELSWVESLCLLCPLQHTHMHTLSHVQKVQNPLKPYVQALMQGMPQKCKMPLYEYGSKGVLGFYQAQLAPVVTYRDLQTDVFQSFKEVGNTILFCLQLEKALVGHCTVQPSYD